MTLFRSLNPSVLIRSIPTSFMGGAISPPPSGSLNPSVLIRSIPTVTLLVELEEEEESLNPSVLIRSIPTVQAPTPPYPAHRSSQSLRADQVNSDL